MTLALILTVLDEAHKEGQELLEAHKNGQGTIQDQAGRCAEEEFLIIRSGACSVHEIVSRVSKLGKGVSGDHIIQLMKDAEPEEFVHRVVGGVKFVTRKKHVAIGESDWTPGFEG